MPTESGNAASIGPVVVSPDSTTEPEYPIEVLCPICFNLLDDPVTWPAPSCEEKHNFCRGCLSIMCDSKDLKSLCPICRAPSTVPILDQLWTLPVDPVLNARIEHDYPEHHAESVVKRERKQREYEALPRVIIPIFDKPETQVGGAGFDCSSLHRGKVVDFRIFTPEHALLLATCFANPEPRFGLLLEGETWGYIAGGTLPDHSANNDIPLSLRNPRLTRSSLVGACACACVPVCLCACVPVCLCACVPACVCVSPLRCAHAPPVISPKLFEAGKPPKSVGQALAKLIMQRQVLKKVLKVQILIVDSFRLDGPLTSEPVPHDLASMLNYKDPSQATPIKFGKVLCSPLGDVPTYVK